MKIFVIYQFINIKTSRSTGASTGCLSIFYLEANIRGADLSDWSLHLCCVKPHMDLERFLRGLDSSVGGGSSGWGQYATTE